MRWIGARMGRNRSGSCWRGNEVMGFGFRFTGYGSWVSQNTLNPTYDSLVLGGMILALIMIFIVAAVIRI